MFCGHQVFKNEKPSSKLLKTRNPKSIVIYLQIKEKPHLTLSPCSKTYRTKISSGPSLLRIPNSQLETWDIETTEKICLNTVLCSKKLKNELSSGFSLLTIRNLQLISLSLVNENSVYYLSIASKN